MKGPSSYRIDSASRVIAASRQAIYEAFVNPESLVLWLPPEGMSARIDRFDARAGGLYQLTLTYQVDHANPGKTSDNTDVSKGRFLELVPDTKIVLVGEFESEDPAFSGEMVQTWFLEAVAAGTKVTIVNERVPEGIRKEDHDDGLNSTLANLARFVEK